MGYSTWGRKESDMTESLSTHGSMYNSTVILTGVNDSGREYNPMGRMTLVRRVDLSGRGVGYDQSEASLESTGAQQPHQRPRPHGNEGFSWSNPGVTRGPISLL